MARYGSGKEDFEAEAAALRARRLAREQLVAKEAAFQESLRVTAGLESEAEIATAARTQARREGIDVARRESGVADQTVSKVNVDTAAVERNTAARRANARARAEEARRAVPVASAVAGARDPAFAQAYRLAEGGNVTQYRIRQQLEGVGSRRAAALQAAVQSGRFRPSEGGTLSDRPFSRQTAATLAVERSEAALAEANRHLANTRRRASASDVERLQAKTAQQEARQARDRARIELASVDQEVTARAENAGASREEAVAHTRAATAATVAGTAPADAGRYLPVRQVHGPTGRIGIPADVRDYSDTEKRALGTYVPGRPGVQSETGAGGRYGGGNQKYDERFEAKQAKLAAEAVDRATKAEARQAAAVDRTAAAEMKATAATEARVAAINAEAAAQARVMAERNAAQVERMLAGEAAATQRLNRATQASGVSYSAVSNQLRRHGALTTEFIAAAARGETTLRELGNQSLATIGKFAGWTAAASAVYGVVGAISQLGKGALDAASGVGELERYRVKSLPGGKDEEQQRFGQLALKYNVPISDVTAAAAGQAKLFKGDLPEAFKATESALALMKVGELSFADATETTNKIVNGFKLNAQDLPGVIDSINQAQQKFGGNTADLAKGVGVASGAFRNAGGTYQQLIAILSTGVRTGAGTAGNVATAVQRAVSTSLTPQGRARLQAVGLNPDQDFYSILQQAQQKAKGASPQFVNQLAKSLIPAGGQFTRIFVPLLQNKKLMDDALNEVQNNSKGSTDRELKAVLEKPSEQIKKLGTELQALGADLARSGAFTALGGMLKSLNAILGAADAVVKTFDRLPHGLTQGLFVLGEIAAVVKLIRHVGAADRLEGTAFARLANPDQRLQKRAVSGLRTTTELGRSELQSANLQQFRIATRAETAREEARKFAASPAFTGTRHLSLDDDERKRVDAHSAQLDSRALALEQQHIAAVAETEALRANVLVHEEQLVRIQQASTKEVRALLAELQIAVPASLEVANLQGVERVAAQRTAAGAAEVAAASTAAAVAFTGAAVATEAAAVASQRLAPTAEHFISPAYSASAVQGQQYRTRAAEVARMDREAAAARGAAVGGTGQYAPLIGSGAARDAQLRGTAPPTGRTNWTGFVGGAENRAATGRLGSAMRSTGSFITGIGRSGAALGVAGTQLARASSAAVGFMGRAASGLRGAGSGLKNLVGGLGPLDFAIAAFFEAEWIKGRLEKAGKKLTDDIDKAGTKEAESIRRLGQTLARQKGNAIPLQTGGELAKAAAQDARDREAGIISLAEFDRRRKLHAVELNHLYSRVVNLPNDASSEERKAAAAADKADRTRAKAALAAAGSAGSPTDYRAALRQMDTAGLSTESDRLGTQIKSQGLSPGRARQLTETYNEAIRQLGGGTDAKTVAEVAKLQDQYYQTLLDGSEDTIKHGLESAHSETERRGLFSRQIASFRARRSTRRGAVSTVEKDLRTAIEQRDEADQTAATFPNVPSLRDRADAAGRRVAALKNKRKTLRRELSAAERKLGDILNQLRDEGYSDRESGRQIDLAYAQSKTTDPLQEQALAVKSAAAQARDALKTYGGGSRQRKQALTELNNAQKAQDEQVKQDGAERIRLLGELAAARAGGDPVRSAQAAQAAARAALGAATKPNDRLQALVDLANANNDLQKALTEREDARYDLLSSRTEDPVAQARIARQRAAYDLTRAIGPADKTAKQAAYNRSVQDYRNAKVQDRQDEINFELQMGQISTSTAASLIRSLARTKNLSKKAKRDLLLQAKQLRDQASGDYELNVDKIRLPSLYEVRRGLQQAGTSRNSSTVYNQNRMNVYVDHTTDMDALAGVFQDALGQGGESAARAVRVR